MLLLQKYYKLFCFLTICSVFCSNCSFPYHTKQARKARKEKRLAKRQAKKEARAAALVTQEVTKDSTILPPIDSNIVIAVDSIPQPIVNQPTITVVTTDSSSIDSLATVLTTLDSLPQDSLKKIAQNRPVGLDSLPVDDPIRESMEKVIRFSEDALTLPVQYESADSMIYDLAERKVYMYNNAEVVYEQYNLKAGYIEFDFETNVATATCLLDSADNEIQCPFFDDKTQQFTSRRIEFNFKTKKGKVYDASTEQGDGYLVSNATKFISSDTDTTGENSQNILYSQGCLYTTCDHKHPHFGIRASKAKIIPGKLIVVGPSFLEIMGSPTPILLPFGFFPITKNKRSGLILSTDLELSPSLGPGINNIGFYINVSDYWDLKVTGDFFLRGSIRARALATYNVRYKGNGSIGINYTRIQNDEPGTPAYSLQQSFAVTWRHTQAPQAHPSQSFTADVNFGTADHYQNTFNDAANVLQATLNSSISYTKRFLGTPFSLSARIATSLITQTRQMTITFPSLTLTMNQIFPFKRKNVAGKSRWYERIGFSYTMNANNTLVTTDTALFAPGGLQQAIDDMQYSITHSPRLNFSFKLFKFINVQPNVNYTQKWFFYRNRQYLDATPVVLNPENPTDTTYGTVETYKDYGFFSTHQFSAGINLNTMIYATGRLNMGALRQVRATFTPSVGFSWTPSYENAYDYYFDSVQYDSRYPENLRRYNYFDYQPPTGRTALLNYSLNTRFEAKVRKSKFDTLTKEPFKKIILIPTATIGGSYNMAADSLHFSPITFSMNTTLFKKINLRFSSVFDPYTANPETNARLNTFEYNVSQRLVRVTSMSINASTNLTAKDIRSIFRKKGQTEDPKKKQFDLIERIGIQYNILINNSFINGVDTTTIAAHQLSFTGSINLSKGWRIGIGSVGYSFKDQRITYPQFTFSRDLHCWEMGLTWTPERQAWNFYIRVKPGTLGFLNVPVQKQFYETF